MQSRAQWSMTGLSALLALALFMGACDTTTDPGSRSPMDGDQARLTILLTDAPGDIAEAWVEITGIYLQVREGDDDGNGDGNGNGDNSGNGDGSNGGRVWLLEGSAGWINLLDLAGTWMELVGDAEVPAGVYSQLRFIVGGSVLVLGEFDAEDNLTIEKIYASSEQDLEDLNEEIGDGLVPPPGTELGDLHCPSCSQTGFKVRFPGGVVVLEPGENVLMVDFDVSETFGHQAGNSGRWIMHPTLLGSVVEGDGDGSGSGGFAL
ncbi:MAG: DUF4382 domain-containing protein [Gemmatimonadota bacterium]|nr:MAG: DUF4382 domain-containing protein [Gemmatimonadota bacterium]